MTLPPHTRLARTKSRYRKAIEGEIRKRKIDGMRRLRDGETITV